MKAWAARAGWMAVGVALLYAMSALAGTAFGGSLDPPGDPASTMKSLDHIPGSWSRKLLADDRNGDPCNSERFRCVLDGAGVLDIETGLVWQQTVPTALQTWTDARHECLNLRIGERSGWRLPAIEEVKSLLHDTTPDRLPAGHPFSGAPTVATNFWTSTSSHIDPDLAYVHGTATIGGGFSQVVKSQQHSYWCVRGGAGYDSVAPFSP